MATRLRAAGIAETRAALTKTVQRFRRDGATAEPVVFGSRGEPEAVVLPYATYRLLMEVAEDVVIAETVGERSATDDGSRRTLEDVAEDLGVDLDAL